MAEGRRHRQTIGPTFGLPENRIWLLAAPISDNGRTHAPRLNRELGTLAGLEAASLRDDPTVR